MGDGGPVLLGGAVGPPAATGGSCDVTNSRGDGGLDASASSGGGGVGGGVDGDSAAGEGVVRDTDGDSGVALAPDGGGRGCDHDVCAWAATVGPRCVTYPHGGGGLGASASGGGGSFGSGEGSGLDSLHGAVLASLNTHCPCDERADLCSAFRELRAKGLDDASVRQAIDFLASEGYLNHLLFTLSLWLYTPDEEPDPPLDSLHGAVLASFDTHCPCDEGADLSSALNELRAKGLDDASVRQAIDFLASEGYLCRLRFTLEEEYYNVLDDGTGGGRGSAAAPSGGGGGRGRDHSACASAALPLDGSGGGDRGCDRGACASAPTVGSCDVTDPHGGDGLGASASGGGGGFRGGDGGDADGYSGAALAPNGRGGGRGCDLGACASAAAGVSCRGTNSHGDGGLGASAPSSGGGLGGGDDSGGTAGEGTTGDAEGHSDTALPPNGGGGGRGCDPACRDVTNSHGDGGLGAPASSGGGGFGGGSDGGSAVGEGVVRDTDGDSGAALAPNGGGGGRGGDHGRCAGAATVGSCDATNSHGGGGLGASASSGGGSVGSGGGSGVDSLHGAVLAAFNTHGHGDVGAHSSSVLHELRAKGHDDAPVRQAIDFLVLLEEGLLYATLDEEHYNVLDDGTGGGGGSTAGEGVARDAGGYSGAALAPNGGCGGCDHGACASATAGVMRAATNPHGDGGLGASASSGGGSFGGGDGGGGAAGEGCVPDADGYSGAALASSGGGGGRGCDPGACASTATDALGGVTNSHGDGGLGASASSGGGGFGGGDDGGGAASEGVECEADSHSDATLAQNGGSGGRGCDHGACAPAATGVVCDATYPRGDGWLGASASSGGGGLGGGDDCGGAAGEWFARDAGSHFDAPPVPNGGGGGPGCGQGAGASAATRGSWNVAISPGGGVLGSTATSGGAAQAATTAAARRIAVDERGGGALTRLSRRARRRRGAPQHRRARDAEADLGPLGSGASGTKGASRRQVGRVTVWLKLAIGAAMGMVLALVGAPPSMLVAAVANATAGHEALSLLRASDGRGPALAVAAAPRLRVGGAPHGGAPREDGGGSGVVTMSVVATADITESAADAPSSRVGLKGGGADASFPTCAAAVRCPTAPQGARRGGGPRAARHLVLRDQRGLPPTGHEAPSLPRVSGARAGDGVGDTMIGHATRSPARMQRAREASDGRETTAAVAATPRRGAESRGSTDVTMCAAATAATAESAAGAVGDTRIGHAARSRARALIAREVGDGRETAVAEAAAPRTRVESRSTHDDGGGSVVVTMGAVATAATAESAAGAVCATRIERAARSLARARVAREAGDGCETAVAAAAIPRPRVGSRNTHDDGGGSGVATMGAVATAAIVESAADTVSTTRIEHAARSRARALVAREVGDGRETAVAAAATPRPRVESRSTHGDGGGSVAVTMGAVATAATTESVADAVDAARIELAARPLERTPTRSLANTLSAREASDGRETAAAVAATPRRGAESRGSTDVTMCAAATAATVEPAAAAVGDTRIGHAARSRARARFAREVGGGRETAVAAAAALRTRVESRSPQDDDDGSAVVTMGAVATAGSAEPAAGAVGVTGIEHVARSPTRALVARGAGDGCETAVAAAATPRPRVESRNTHDGSGGSGVVTTGAVATAAIAESAAGAGGATKIEHETRSLARELLAREVGDGRETATAAAATSRLRVESRGTHDDGGDSAAVTMGAVASADTTKSAADAVGAARIELAARPLARAPVTREAGDGSETVVAAAAANIHDDGSGSGSLRLARATAAIAESAAGAGDATRIEREARSLSHVRCSRARRAAAVRRPAQRRRLLSRESAP